MRIMATALGVVAMVVIAGSVGTTLASSRDNLSATLEPNGAHDAGCLAGEMSVEVGDFGEIVPDGDLWRGSQDVVLTIPLSQNLVPGAIDCRIEFVASDLAIAGTTSTIPGSHLAIAGCDLGVATSLEGPRAMTCSVDTATGHVEVLVSLVGLDQRPAGPLHGTIVVSGVNGT